MQRTAEPLPLWRRLLSVAFLLLLVAAAGLVLWQRVWIQDWLRLRGYQPPAAIAQLAKDDGLSPYAQRLFYVNRPVVEARDSFNAHCSEQAGAETAVLGCFTGDRQGIYIYDVTDPRLAGIQQVTAAHEMLHQAYQRLSHSERVRVDGLLEAYAKTITSPALKDKVALYKQIEPDDVVNEMHSVFGTEVANLPPALETYYQRYFSDRQRVTTYHQNYQDAFDRRTAQIAAYNKQLDALRTQITAQKAALDAEVKTIQQRHTILQAYLANQQIDAYNAAVPGYNALVNQYKREVAAINELIHSYNKIIDKVNAIAVQERQLISAQDSRSIPAGQ